MSRVYSKSKKRRKKQAYQNSDSNKCYDFYICKRALQLIKSNPYESKILFEEYLEKYPDDYMAKSFYVSNLIVLREFELAEVLIAQIENEVYGAEGIKDESREKINDVKCFVINKVKLMSCQGKYRELLDYLDANPEYIKRYNLEEVRLYCKTKLGINHKKREGQSYVARQIIEYRREDMLTHANYHTEEHDDSIQESYKNVFFKEFPLYKIICEIKSYIPSDRALCTGILTDSYYFRYDNCGSEGNKITNYFKVITFHGSSDIISILPTVEGEYLPYVDLNELNQVEKPKEMSRAERFYKRYGI